LKYQTVLNQIQTAAEDSMSAYKACKSLVDTVQQALIETFKE